MINNRGEGKMKKNVSMEEKFHKAARGKSSKIHRKHSYVLMAGLMLYDVMAVISAYFLALWLRFDCHYTLIPDDYFLFFMRSIMIYVAICILVFWRTRLYKSIWRFASYNELLRVSIASIFTIIVYIVGMSILGWRMPVSYYIIGFVFQFLFTLGVRFLYRFVLLLRGRREEKTGQLKKIMVIGAGASGRMILRDIKQSKETSEKVCCLINDDPNKQGRYIDGIPVVGVRHEIKEACKKYEIEKIYVAIPSAKAEDKREILEIYNETSCDLMNLPGMYQLYTGEVSVSKMKEVSVGDLLGRDPIKVNMEEIFQYIKGKVILVTGGGGSIGSELCRQIAAHEPKQLIIFDIYENNAYDIQLELKRKYPSLNLEVRIGSVRDSRMIFKIFGDYKL